MLQLLPDPRTFRAERPTRGILVAAGVHATAVILFVVLSRSAPGFVETTFAEVLRYLSPAATTPPVPDRMQFAGAPAGAGGPVAAAAQGAASPATGPGEGTGAAAPVDREPPPADFGPDVFTVAEVDSAAVPEATSVAPAYPRSMMDAGIDGSATMRFVVDSLGRIDMATVLVLGATRPEFAAAVMQAMPMMRFRPARMGTIAVRQLAEQKFRFEIQRPAKAPDRPTKP